MFPTKELLKEDILEGKIVSQMQFGGGVRDYVRFGKEIKRLVVAVNNSWVAITPYEDHIFALPHFSLAQDNCTVLGDIEVPDELVKQAIESTELQKKLFDQVEELLKKT
ncbi:MAG TPA: hypothetical protein VLH94_02470 [Spirochaetia bacterium]|nr:hypothetical protein [Spirochaetia bacterium]